MFLEEAVDKHGEDGKITNDLTANLEIIIVNSLAYTNPELYCE